MAVVVEVEAAAVGVPSNCILPGTFGGDDRPA
jgi:hypothetical protein